ncbi:hypothetical protein [Lysinibacillus sp. SGAir0095]|uniref:hypothetical protein n=1 Tax=Lysinibacillus sp. SGAir0095 TaxID=2070463 RepID=UPI0010CD21F6|nr:hypothetical protein [Lysinibacillus sp. SGAir0095]QCR33910.1 hypothetical protein C1N55_18020 [Lysinibacillus sp. SGAir0095]
MKYKHWFWLTILLTCLFMIPFIRIAAFNFYVDPLWNFSHQNEHNEHQIGFDERQLKVNYLSQKQHHYDTLVVGTSRTTYINQNHFTDMNAYNFSASSLDISEYEGYITYASEKNNGFETIILEVYPRQFPGLMEFPEPSVYIANNEEKLYSIKSLFSFDTYEKAKRNYTQEGHPTPAGYRIYNRENVVSTEFVSPGVRDANIEKGINKLNTLKTFKDEKGYVELLSQIKKNNPDSTFLVYSPPYYIDRTKKVFNSEAGIAYYRDWLEDLIEVFGGVINFTTFNDITVDRDYYIDTHHFYPSTGKLVANDIAAFHKGDDLRYATYITEENLSQFMEQFEEQIFDGAVQP